MQKAQSTTRQLFIFHSGFFFTLAELRVIKRFAVIRDDVVYVSEQGDGLKTTLILFQPSNVCASGTILFDPRSGMRRNSESPSADECKLTVV
jgi:hypothetical protein